MKPTRIKFKNYTLRLNVRHPEIEPDEETKTQTVGDFYREFMRLGQSLVKAPQRNPSQRDLGIAKHLLTRYDHATLMECARRYWYRWSDPYFLEPRDVMVLFAKVLPDIEAGIDKNAKRSSE